MSDRKSSITCTLQQSILPFLRSTPLLSALSDRLILVVPHIAGAFAGLGASSFGYWSKARQAMSVPVSLFLFSGESGRN